MNWNGATKYQMHFIVFLNPQKLLTSGHDFHKRCNLKVIYFLAKMVFVCLIFNRLFWNKKSYNTDELYFILILSWNYFDGYILLILAASMIGLWQKTEWIRIWIFPFPNFLNLMLPITSNFTIHSNKNISIKVVKLNINAHHYLVHSRIFLCVCVSSLHHAKEEVKERYKKTKAFISVYLIIDKRYDFYLVACHSVQKN